MVHSIRFRITAITIAAILITVVCVLAGPYSILRAENNRYSAVLMSLISQNTGKSVEKYTESIEQSMQMISNIAADSLDSVILAENGVIGSGAGQAGPTPAQQRQLDEYLTGYCGGIENTFTGIATHTHGVVTYYYCINPEVSVAEHGFFYSRVGKTGFEVQPPLDARTLDPEDMAHTTWYYTPIQRGRPSWVGPYTAHFLGEMWICSYIVPVYKSGTLIGLIGMDIPVETLISQVSAIRVFKTGYACLVDADDRVLYHPDLPMGSSLDLLGVEGLADKLRRQSSGDEVIRYSSGDEERQLSFTALSNGMKLIVSAPVAEINASWARLVRIIMPVTAGAIVSFALLIYFVMQLITRPLQRLTAASERLAAGDFDVPLEAGGPDEVGKLIGAFIQMRDQQKQYFDDLNRQLYTDRLTGLPNMRHFFKLAEARRRSLRESGKPSVMLYFDLIDMKHFNRQFGFEEGDRLICEVGQVLARHYGAMNMCRFIGDHFAAVTEEANVYAELKVIFEECQRVNDGKAQPLRVGIYPDRLEDVSVSIACDRAKFACDQHREIYESSFCYFDSVMLKRGEDYRYFIKNIDRAIAEKWIKVYYQPIIRAADGKVCDEEALSRWIDPVRGFVSPADFIPALEKSKLIYKLDLYVVEQVLEKIRRQAAVGMYVVPQSVNLSRMDFDSCDIVEEIRRRVDDAGVERSMLTIEITESVIGSDFDFMKAQVERFQSLGFQVWMDDFGSGYSSLDVLKGIQFDLIKFDMRFMDDFDSGEKGRIILTELTKMAMGLGVETVCEGVEKAEMVEFLKEIGCTKIQGYYYGKPIPFEEMLSRYQSGVDMGLENPEESEYYTTLGRINLYDMSVIAGEGDDSLSRYFDTLPTAILEVNGSEARFTRCNKSYRDFMERVFGITQFDALKYTGKAERPSAAFIGAVMRCSRDGNRAIIDEPIDDRTTVHTFIRRIAVNPVTGTAAIAVAVLAVMEEPARAGVSFASVSEALPGDYINLYYVDLETEQFIEFTPDGSREDLVVERRGANFFSASAQNANLFIHVEDRERFIAAFTRENVLRTIDGHGMFTLSYRLLMNGTATRVTMRAVRMPSDSAHIIVGVSSAGESTADPHKKPD